MIASRQRGRPDLENGGSRTTFGLDLETPELCVCVLRRSSPSAQGASTLDALEDKMSLSRLLALAGITIAAACGGSSSTPTSPTQPPAGTVSVTIQDFTFSPATVTIKAGTTVRWTNNGPSAHTTTSDAGAWNSGTLSPPGGGGGYGGGSAGGTFDFTFMQPGTFGYHCSIHPPSLYPNFVGTVTVNP
jgi:plastocyanin